MRTCKRVQPARLRFMITRSVDADMKALTRCNLKDRLLSTGNVHGVGIAGRLRARSSEIPKRTSRTKAGAG